RPGGPPGPPGDASPHCPAKRPGTSPAAGTPGPAGSGPGPPGPTGTATGPRAAGRPTGTPSPGRRRPGPGPSADPAAEPGRTPMPCRAASYAPAHVGFLLTLLAGFLPVL